MIYDPVDVRILVSNKHQVTVSSVSDERSSEVTAGFQDSDRSPFTPQ